MGDVAEGLATHQQPGDLPHRLAQDHRGHDVANSLGLSLISEKISVYVVFELFPDTYSIYSRPRLTPSLTITAAVPPSPTAALWTGPISLRKHL